MPAETKKSGRLAAIARHRVTRTLMFLAVFGLFSNWLLTYVSNNGGVKSGLEQEHKLVAELSLDQAKLLFSPSATDLHPKAIYIEICDAKATDCQLQLSDDEVAAADQQSSVAFYHIDQSKEPVLYQALYSIIVKAAGKPIPQAFPLRTLWKVGFKFEGSQPTASPEIVNLGEGIVPAGGVVDWIQSGLNPPAPAAAPTDKAATDGGSTDGAKSNKIQPQADGATSTSHP